MDAKSGTKAGDELDVLATLVEAYEAKHYAICPPDPIEVIKFRMDQLGLTRGTGTSLQNPHEETTVIP